MKTTRQNAFIILSFTFMAFILGTTEYIIVAYSQKYPRASELR
ncbi:putative MFS family arabinose efflux permease [Paenibacillus sp. DS2015]